MSGINKEYDAISAAYEQVSRVPFCQLERRLVAHGLSDCKGKSVLDLGGEVGIHARKALDLGASNVDIVDISPGMLKDGKLLSSGSGHKDGIRWFVGDISGDLGELPLSKSYDTILVGWTFDHAETDKQLEGMWRNVAHYASPGAILINTRMTYLPPVSVESGKYGVLYHDYKEIPGGMSYAYTAKVDPPWTCPATSMYNTLELEKSKVMAGKYGFGDYQVIDPASMDLVKEDTEFWQSFVQQPYFVVCTATKS